MGRRWLVVGSLHCFPNLSIYVFIYLSIYAFVHLSIYVLFYLCTYLSSYYLGKSQLPYTVGGGGRRWLDLAVGPLHCFPSISIYVFIYLFIYLSMILLSCWKKSQLSYTDLATLLTIARENLCCCWHSRPRERVCAGRRSALPLLTLKMDEYPSLDDDFEALHAEEMEIMREMEGKWVSDVFIPQTCH